MKGHVDSKLGEVIINPDVIATYAGSIACECFGIVGMAAVNMKDGLVRLLKKDSLKHGINVVIEDNKISLEFHVIVAYGVSISTIAQNLIESVKYQLENYTGMTVDKVSIQVEGIRVID
ncbi:MAG: Asp23/Gls24 family envelope stress response protein [Eubacteriales bacterium]|nr:Asp23/Gls24 family envelope stress response protein [Eubacteriales bacterium]